MVTVFKQIHQVLPCPKVNNLGFQEQKNTFLPPRNLIPELVGQGFRKNEHKGKGKLVKEPGRFPKSSQHKLQLEM